MTLSLPAIPLPQAVDVEEVPAKTYGHVWTTRVDIHAPHYGVGDIYLEMAPMVVGTGEVHPSIRTEIRTDKLWEAAESVPEVAAAMGAILSAIGPLQTWLASQNQ
ncbi:MAG: hypothetical protein E6Q97_11045 [Desulfurellales bacterium]|nr:MAG: hypothetical protein E6Q97_11045 [Desulfurellales bacterium]